MATNTDPSGVPPAKADASAPGAAAAGRPDAKAWPLYAACPLCASTALRDRWTVNGFQLTRCGGCTLLFVRDQVDDGFLKDYYAAGADSRLNQLVYQDPRNQAFLGYAYRAMADRLRRMLGPGRHRLLDVGCSTGGFFDHLDGWDFAGVEISPLEAEIARRKGAAVFTGILPEADFAPGSFDCATLQDSLDHCREPVEVMRDCGRLLRPGGIVALKVHNIDCLLARLTGKRFYAILPPGHLFYFSLATLKIALDKAGYDYRGHFFNTQRLQLGVAVSRLAQGREDSVWRRMADGLNACGVGRLPLYKNLRDIITVFGAKR